MKENVLIIFTKNLIYGKVKTRLAAAIGDDEAFKIYKQLVEKTHSVTEKVKCDKIIFYSEYIEQNDLWNKKFIKVKQQGNDLGERMMDAFKKVFQKRYFKAIIIGTDCPSLNEKIINDAFEELNKNDIVIGPANDGGYYLLGMKKFYPQLFEGVNWSTETVFNETINICNKLNLHYLLLPVLTDIDEEKDLKYFQTYSS